MTTDQTRRPPALRPEVASLPRYVPGERPAEGREVFKLSSNEMPHGALPGVAEAVAASLEDVARYPDMAATELVAALALRHGVEADQVAVGAGSSGVLEAAVRAVAGEGDEVVMAWRSFESYPIAVQVTGARAVQVPLDDVGRHDLPAMVGAVTGRTRAVLLCSPNNPTGPAITATELAGVLGEIPPGVLVILDEAYIDFVTHDDRADGLAVLAEHPNLLVLRTFSKAASLAGLRVGYGVGHPEIVGGVRAASTPFGVSAPAQAAALVALRSTEEIVRRVVQVVAERARLRAGLIDLGHDVPDAQGNFVWLPIGERSRAFADAARGAGVLVRAFPQGVRITVGTTEATDAVLGVAAEFAAAPN